MELEYEWTGRALAQNWESCNRSFLDGQLIFSKDVKVVQWEKDSLFNMWCLNNWLFLLAVFLFLIVYNKAILDFHKRNDSLLRNLKLRDHNGIKLEINTEEIWKTPKYVQI